MINIRLTGTLTLSTLLLLLPLSAQQPTPKPRTVSDAPSTPARITLVNGQLTVDARNSNLTQILDDTARLTGLSITGRTGGKRIDGVYGPGSPRTVLTSILHASGYNFLLIGGNTYPRQLILMIRRPDLPASEPAKHHSPDIYAQQYAELESGAPY